MQTTDTGLLFQTEDQITDGKRHAKKLVAAAKVGQPINVNGKIIDFIISGSTAYIAESGWQARQLDLKVGPLPFLSVETLHEHAGDAEEWLEGWAVVEGLMEVLG